MIDLDHGPGAPAAEHRRRVWPAVAAAVLLSGLVSGLAVHRWDEQRGRDTVGVLVLADASDWVGDRVEAGSQGTARIYGHVAIVNAGPAAFRVRGLSGITVNTITVPDRWVDPAGVSYQGFDIELPCAGTDLFAMRVTVRVEPRDAAVRNVDALLDGHPWAREFTKACA